VESFTNEDDPWQREERITHLVAVTKSKMDAGSKTSRARENLSHLSLQSCARHCQTTILACRRAAGPESAFEGEQSTFEAKADT
jgi:hypothetical protein